MKCPNCGILFTPHFDGWGEGNPLVSSEASEGPKPPTREGGGVRVERFDGLHASEASGPASAIEGVGAGKATEPGAAGEALRDENSQLPDGLPSRGDGESERSCATCLYFESESHEYPCCICTFQNHTFSKWHKSASVKPIIPAETRASRSLQPIVGTGGLNDGQG